MPIEDTSGLIAGRYRRGPLIATGGMGKIYRAEQVKLGRTVALKVLASAVSGHDDEFRQRFELEAATCAQLTHPNVVTVFDYGAFMDGDREACYMVMELVDGITLSNLIKKTGPLPADRVLKLARQIGRALRAAHAIDVVHRDLKPSNVMMVQTDEGESVKVLDFGLAKVTRDDAPDLTHSGKFLGSPRYMSPEQIRGGAVDGRSDIYSLGVMMYQMLCGDTPFGAEKVVHTLMAHLNQEVPPMTERGHTDASPELQALVYKCLEKEPEKRWQTIGELMSAMRTLQAKDSHFLSHETPVDYAMDPDWVGGPASSSGPRLKPLAPTGAVAKRAPHRRTMAVAALGALAGVAMGVATWRSPSPEESVPAPTATAMIAPVVQAPSAPAAAAPPPVAVQPQAALLAPQAAAPQPVAPAPEARPTPAAPAQARRNVPSRPQWKRPARRAPLRRPAARPAAKAVAPRQAPPKAAAPVAAVAPPPSKPAPQAQPEVVAPATEPLPAPRSRSKSVRKAVKPVAPSPAPVVPKPAPRVARKAAVGAVTVDGSLATSVVKRAVDRLQSRFTSCYAKATEGRPTDPTAVDVEVTIEPSGHVSRADARGGKWPELNRCVSNTARRIVPRRRPDLGRVRARFRLNYGR